MSFDAKALSRLIETSGVSFKQNAISFIFTCPRCRKKDKLYIRKRDGQFVCWICKETDNFKGRAEWALRELLESISVREIQEKLYGGDLPEQLRDELVLEFDSSLWGEGSDLDEDEVATDPEPEEVLWPPQFVTPENEYAFVNGARYLVSRGLTMEHVRTYDIRYDPTEQRVIFPVKVDGKLIGWQSRYIKPAEFFDEARMGMVRIPKILTSDTLRNTGGRYLMFQDRLKGSPHCILAEGPVSAIKAHLCGGNVASMGKAVTANQLDTILRHGIRKLYIALDPDAASEVSRILRTIDPDVETYLLLPPKGREDLGDATQEEVYEQFKCAPRVERGSLMFSLGSLFVH